MTTHRNDIIVDKVRMKMERDASLFEIVVVVMEEVDKFNNFTGRQKQEYVVEILLHTCKIDIDEKTLKDTIELVIKLTHGVYKINQRNKCTGFFAECFDCFGCKADGVKRRDIV